MGRLKYANDPKVRRPVKAGMKDWDLMVKGFDKPRMRSVGTLFLFFIFFTKGFEDENEKRKEDREDCDCLSQKLQGRRDRAFPLHSDGQKGKVGRST